MNKNLSNSKEVKCSLCCGILQKSAKVCPHCGNRINRLARFIHNYLIQICIGALVGVISFHYGQRLEQKRQEAIAIERQNKVNDKTITLLKIELSQNWAELGNIEKLLKADIANLNENKIIVIPLGHFNSETWDFVKFGESDFLFRSDTADFSKLVNCYFVLKLVENKIKDREQYRLLKEGDINFKERFAVLDQSILGNVELAKKHMEESQNYLDSIHNWIVKGRSFQQFPDGTIKNLNR
ncbi:MAG: hypothetical protein NTX71_03365 [Candidatus Aureabacteria bacterium]|nr:hypothetical protein [Candidatus Auribacterota bacterium]